MSEQLLSASLKYGQVVANIESEVNVITELKFGEKEKKDSETEKDNSSVFLLFDSNPQRKYFGLIPVWFRYKEK